MSTLTLDRADGGVDAMVAPWKVGGEYEIHLKVKQTGATPETATFEVIEATDETMEAAPEEEVAPAPKPKVGKPPITVPKY